MHTANTTTELGASIDTGIITNQVHNSTQIASETNIKKN